ncbi:movement protein [Sesamum angolense]|uniref:Movement protein n=1 Tax=Sesamum angolense TaxID=2727404 RepID=A0AAE1W3U2_9LAMI|nr:movement protein [Sesamum angolense]
MRESSDFHTNATPTFVGTKLRENPKRNPGRALENRLGQGTMLQPLYPYGAILNLDVIDFRNIEKLINEWVVATNIVTTALELDKENFIKLVELSLEGSLKIGWDNTQQILKPENPESQGRGRSKVVTPTLGVPEEPFLGGDNGSPNQKPEHTNLDKGVAQKGLHPKDLDQQIQDPQGKPLLSDGPIPGPMKASNTATAGHVEQELIPKEEILEELSKLREETVVTMKWIHIVTIEAVIKASFKEGIDSKIHLSIMDRRINNIRDGHLGTMIGNLYVGKLMFDIHPRIAYNLADQDFSRVLTLHQDFKRKDLMKEGKSVSRFLKFSRNSLRFSDKRLRHLKQNPSCQGLGTSEKTSMSLTRSLDD